MNLDFLDDLIAIVKGEKKLTPAFALASLGQLLLDVSKLFEGDPTPTEEEKLTFNAAPPISDERAVEVLKSAAATAQGKAGAAGFSKEELGKAIKWLLVNVLPKLLPLVVG